MALGLFEVFEDALDGMGLGELANDPEFPGASGTGRDVDIEHPVEAGHPTHRRAGRTAGVVTFLSAVTAAVPGHDEVTVPGIGRSRTSVCFAAPALPCALGANRP